MTIKLHIFNNDIIRWTNNGVTHNKFGPSSTWINRSKFWWYCGEQHRLDGPAVEWADGEIEWWVDGIEYYTYLEYLIAVDEYKLNKETNGN